MREDGCDVGFKEPHSCGNETEHDAAYGFGAVIQKPQVVHIVGLPVEFLEKMPSDFAAESANLTRAQILVQSGTAVLSIANKNPENVLALLR